MLAKIIFYREDNMGRHYLEVLQWLVADPDLSQVKHKQHVLTCTLDSLLEIRESLFLTQDDIITLEHLKRYPKIIVKMKAFMILHKSNDEDAWIWATKGIKK